MYEYNVMNRKPYSLFTKYIYIGIMLIMYAISFHKQIGELKSFISNVEVFYLFSYCFTNT